jgi:hypothetical protein
MIKKYSQKKRKLDYCENNLLYYLYNVPRNVYNTNLFV